MLLDFIAGCLGGFAGVLIGHPLDTVKVHLQTQEVANPKYRGVLHCIKTIWSEEKHRGLYRGMSSPLAGLGLVNAIVFGVYGNVQRNSENPNSLYSHFLAGGVAGFFQSFVCTPMELAKTRVQLQNINCSPKFNGSYDCLKHIFRTNGFSGLFKGFSVTALRDVPGFATYFISFEYFMSLTQEPNAFQTLTAGGSAGVCSWIACYPIDVVKTCIQADGTDGVIKYKGPIDCIKKEYHSNGLRFFFRGISSTIIRAFPMNAACFLVVSLIMRLTKKMPFENQHSEEMSNALFHCENKPLIYNHSTDILNTEQEYKRFLMIKKLQALFALSEAINDGDAEQLAYDFYPGAQCSKYFLFEDERIK